MKRGPLTILMAWLPWSLFTAFFPAFGYTNIYRLVARLSHLAGFHYFLFFLAFRDIFIILAVVTMSRVFIC